MIIIPEKELPLEDVLYRIEYADHKEIDEMLHAVQRRYSRIFPDWEICFFTLRRNDRSECAQQVELLIETLKKAYLD